MNTIFLIDIWEYEYEYYHTHNDKICIYEYKKLQKYAS